MSGNYSYRNSPSNFDTDASTIYVEYLAEQSTPTQDQSSGSPSNSPVPKRPGIDHVHTDCLHGEVQISEGEATRIVGVFVCILSHGRNGL